MIRETENWTLQTIASNTGDCYRLKHNGLSSTFEHAAYVADGNLHLYSHGHNHTVATNVPDEIVDALEEHGGLL